MKKEYLNDVLEALKEAKDLRWIDADEGQLDFYTRERPPVAWPCCLVDLSMPDARSLTAAAPDPQRCTLRATLRIAFNDCASLNMATPTPVRLTAMKRYDVLQEVKDCLHGKWFSGFQQPYTRISCTPEPREDGIKVFQMVFEAVVLEI